MTTHKRHENDYYPTPDSAITPLLDILNFSVLSDKWHFAEPCRGEAKAIFKFLPEDSQYCELSEGKDYLTSSWDYRPDCIITNPPFTLALEFLQKSLDEADVCIYFLRLGFLESLKRRDFHQKNPVDHLVVLSKRPSFTTDGKTDKTCYAWFIYDPKGKLGLDRPVYVV